VKAFVHQSQTSAKPQNVSANARLYYKIGGNRQRNLTIFLFKNFSISRKVTIYILGNLLLESFPFTNVNLISIFKLPPAFRSLIFTFYKISERLFSFFYVFTIPCAISSFHRLERF